MRELKIYYPAVKRKVLLKDMTTLKVGGPADYFFDVKSKTDLEKAVLFAEENKLKTFVLGGGSNVLFSDNGFPGVVIYLNMRGVEYEDVGDKIRVTAQAGENWDKFVEEVVNKNLYGLENLSAIPGTVGASPVQNIGAYGVEVSDCIESVLVFDTKEKKHSVYTKKDCQFGYRDSIFKKEKGSLIVTAVSFMLSKKAELKLSYKDIEEYFKRENITPTLSELRKAIVNIRTKKMPDWRLVGTAGSFFKNPMISQKHYEELKNIFGDIPGFVVSPDVVKIPIAWILDKVLNLKGYREGDVGLHNEQALILVNYGKATASEIDLFAEKISKMVREKTKIILEREVVCVS